MSVYRREDRRSSRAGAGVVWPLRSGPLFLFIPLFLILTGWTWGQSPGGSELVFVGTVTDQETVIDQASDLPVTRTRLRVEQVLHGSAPEEVVITEYGGRRGGRIVVVSHAARYRSGARYLIVSRTRSDGTRVTAGGPVGRLPIVADARGREFVLVGSRLPLSGSRTVRPGFRPLQDVVGELSAEGRQP